MCRIQICMTKGEMQVSDAFIGYDRPMRTFFIQGFLKGSVANIPVGWRGPVFSAVTRADLRDSARAAPPPL